MEKYNLKNLPATFCVKINRSHSLWLVFKYAICSTASGIRQYYGFKENKVKFDDVPWVSAENVMTPEQFFRLITIPSMPYADAIKPTCERKTMYALTLNAPYQTIPVKTYLPAFDEIVFYDGTKQARFVAYIAGAEKPYIVRHKASQELLEVAEVHHIPVKEITVEEALAAWAQLNNYPTVKVNLKDGQRA